MRTKLLLLCVLVICAVNVNAQSKDAKAFKIGAGAMIGLPMGDMSDWATLAFGVDLMGEYEVAESVAVTLSAGYVDWAYKNGASDGGIIPVLAGVKYNFSEKMYGSVQAGMSFGTASGSESSFTYAPSVGYKLTDKFDLSIKYQAATKNSFTTAFLGLRAGYTF